MSPKQLLAYFDRIAEAPGAVPRLRRFILDLAVRGKLVEQDAGDEPAQKVLRRIGNDDLSAAKRKHERFDDSEGHTPFDIPSSWSWARLRALSSQIHYGYTASADAQIRTTLLLRITDIQNNRVDWSSVPGCLISDADIAQYGLRPGDILVARTGGTVGKTFLVGDVPHQAVFASYLIRIQPLSEVSPRYLKLFFESSFYWTQLEKGTRGGAQPNVNGKTLAALLVSFPPTPRAAPHRSEGGRTDGAVRTAGGGAGGAGAAA